MKLSISNIAWAAEHDAEMYQYLNNAGFNGLEIAPTRIYPDDPYDKLSEAKEWAAELKKRYGLVIPSMQSIWYGHTEKIFGDKDDRQILIDYTKKAVLFAESIGCGNLVFGNPKNRDTEDVVAIIPIAIDFFKEIGDFAAEHHTVIALEPNPTIYNTRFLNYTEQAVEMAYKVSSNGIKVNVDLGTIIHNEEDINYLKQVSEFINHVHISEPGLKMIEQRNLHKELMKLLTQEGYQRFVSIEMGKREELIEIENVLKYVRNVFS